MLLRTGALIALCGVTAASIRHLCLLNFKHIELDFSKPLLHWTWLKYPKDEDPFLSCPIEVRKGGSWMRLALHSGEEEGMNRSLHRSLLGWLGLIWLLWQRVLMFCWPCRALDLDRALLYRTQGMCWGTHCRALQCFTWYLALILSPYPAAFKSLFSWEFLEGNLLGKNPAWSIEIPVLEFNRVLMDSSRLGHFCCQFWLVGLLA